MARTNSRSRRAMLLMSVLVCTTLILLLSVAWIKTIGLERRQLRAQHERLQADYLAESGLRRAAGQLAGDAAYAGETWRVGAEELGGHAGGVVTIRVEAVPERPEARRVVAVADYPDESIARSRRSKETEIIRPTRPETQGDKP